MEGRYGDDDGDGGGRHAEREERRVWRERSEGLQRQSSRAITAIVLGQIPVVLTVLGLVWSARGAYDEITLNSERLAQLEIAVAAIEARENAHGLETQRAFNRLDRHEERLIELARIIHRLIDERFPGRPYVPTPGNGEQK